MNTIQYTHSEDSFKNRNGLNIYFQSWEPHERLRGCVIIAHGLGEHSGRYLDLAKYIVPKGITVFALDHQGHGQSEGKRGCVSRFNDFVEDFHQFRLNVSSRSDNVPLFIAGQSMGGLIAFKYLLDYGEGISAGILSSPEFELAIKVPAIKLWVGKLCSRIAPNITMPNGLNPRHMSRDLGEVQKYKDDPLNHDRISGRLFVEMLKTMAECKARAPEMKIPLLLIYGGEDKIVSGSGSKLLFENVSSTDKKVILYPDSYHELYHELDKDKVFNQLYSWLKPRFGEKN